MDVKFITADQFAKSSADLSVLQGKEFIELKTDAGWTPRYIQAGDHYMSAIEKSILPLGKVWYMPKGPAVASKEDLKLLADNIRPFGRKHGVFTIKIEPELDHATDLTDLGMIKTRPVQYNYATVLVDLAPSVDEIMAGLNQKGRHAIRRAERDGVTVQKVPISDENCQIMYKLLSNTGKAAGFAVRPYGYYKKFYETYGDNGGLFFAYYEGQVVAGAFAMIQGHKSMYKDGASIRERTAYGASHLLQWEVVKWAKSKGSVEHDLAGTPPIDQIKNPDHPLYGLGRFKTSFNKTVTQYVGAYELPIVRWKAVLWTRYVEKLVRRVYFKRHGQSYY